MTFEERNQHCLFHFQVKFTELTIDTFRMLQCLEYEPSGSQPSSATKQPAENGTLSDHSGVASGLIDINLASDLADPNMPLNPRKAVIYHPTASHVISVSFQPCQTLSLELSTANYSLHLPYITPGTLFLAVNTGYINFLICN